MNVGSLFSGIGGIEIGFEKTGYETSWFVENDLHAQTILKKRFPKAKIYDDITKIDFTKLPRVDILTGGFPCQDISNAGKRAGIEGSRSSLWKYYLQAIRILRPKYSLIENVSALLNRGLDVVLSDLASIGYDAEWHCISASSVGALHKRDRIFIIAYPSGERLSEQTNEQELESERRNQLELRESRNQTNVADSFSFGNREESNRRINKSSMESISDTDKWGLERSKEERRNERNAFGSSSYGWWSVEPNLGRVANGIPFRVDRIKRLGNAVVPQCAEVFAKAIKEKDLTFG